MILRMALIESRAAALEAARNEAARIAAIAKYLRDEGALSATASLPIAGSVVIYSDGRCKRAASYVRGMN